VKAKLYAPFVFLIMVKMEIFFSPPVTRLNYHGTINLNPRESFRAG